MDPFNLVHSVQAVQPVSHHPSHSLAVLAVVQSAHRHELDVKETCYHCTDQSHLAIKALAKQHHSDGAYTSAQVNAVQIRIWTPDMNNFQNVMGPSLYKHIHPW